MAMTIPKMTTSSPICVMASRELSGAPCATATTTSAVKMAWVSLPNYQVAAPEHSLSISVMPPGRSMFTVIPTLSRAHLRVGGLHLLLLRATTQGKPLSIFQHLRSSFLFTYVQQHAARSVPPQIHFRVSSTTSALFRRLHPKNGYWLTSFYGN